MTVKSLKLTGDWKKAQEVLDAAPADLEQAIRKAILGLGNYLVGKIRKKMGTNVPPPNSPFTILMKKSSKTLLDKGDLRNSATVIEDGPMGAFIGFPQAGGAAELANILEKGRTIVIRMTPKMRAYLHATLGQKSSKIPDKGGTGTGVIVIHIPGRPFIEPVFDEEEGKIDKVFAKLLIGNLKALKPAPVAGAPPGNTQFVGTPSQPGKKLVWVKTKKGDMVRRWVNN